MADTHYHRTLDDLAYGPSATVQPVLAGVVAVMLVGSMVLMLHALVFGRHASEVWRLGIPLAVGGTVMIVLTAILSRNARRAPRLYADEPPPEPLSPADARRSMRRHRRFVPRHRATTLTTLDGRTIAARIVDLSLGGVAVEARISDIEFATVARVGSRVANPIRRTAAGAVFSFESFLDPMGVNENLVL